MKYAWKILLVLLCAGLLIGAVSAAAPTTSVEISWIAADNITVLANETVTYAWMKDNLPITGDGVTHYGHQGPIFEAAQGYYGDPWDPQEIINTDDAGVLRGTSVLDLAMLVGGIPEGSTVKIIASDGLSRTFSSSYILTPTPEMEPLVLVWEVDGVNVSAAGTSGDASDGMRIYFFADDGIFGNYDMLQTMPENERYNYSSSYPSTRGLSVQYVDRIQIYTDETEYTKAPTPTPSIAPITGSDDTKYLYDGIIAIKNTGTFTETVNGISYEIPWYSPAGVLRSLDFDAEYLVRLNGNLYFESFTDLETGTVYKDDYINVYNAADLTTTLPADVEIFPGDVIYIQFGGDKYKIEGSTAVIRAEVYSPTGKTATWPLFLNGAVEIPLDKDYFEADASTHARVTYTDANGDVWSGVPLRILVGMADDIEANGASHYTSNSTRSVAGYTIKLTNGDGTISTVNTNVLPETRNSDMTFTDDYLISDTLNGVKTALTFVGSSVPAKLTDVRSIDMDVSAFEPAVDSWSIDLFGNINGTLADTFLYEAVDNGCAPTHNNNLHRYQR